jgi:hypothetical protein
MDSPPRFCFPGIDSMPILQNCGALRMVTMNSGLRIAKDFFGPARRTRIEKSPDVNFLYSFRDD